MEGFLIGGISGCIATFGLYPIESIKSRAQMYGEFQKIKCSSFKIAYNNIQSYGFSHLYTGVGYAMARQMSYTSLRIGMYDNGIRKIKSTRYDTIPVKMGIGLGAGMCSSFITAPFDKIMLNGQVGNAHKFPFNRSQFFGMWRGSSTTIARASVINSISLTVNNVLVSYSDSWINRLFSSSIAGAMAATVSLPFDIVRTRVLTDQTKKYTGAFDCVDKIVRHEGFSALYKGYPMYLGRVGTQSSIILFLSETMRRRLSAYSDHTNEKL